MKRPYNAVFASDEHLFRRLVGLRSAQHGDWLGVWRGISKMRSQYELERKNPDGKIKATPPFGRFAVVGQWVRAVPPERGGGAAFPENPMESTRIAPPIAVLRVLAGRMRDGKGKAWPSRPRIWLG